MLGSLESHPGIKNPKPIAAAIPTPIATFGNTLRTAGSGGTIGSSRGVGGGAGRSPLIVFKRERLDYAGLDSGAGGGSSDSSGGASLEWTATR